MKVGFVGLGKLGLPVALSIENKGHEVVGTDVDPNVALYVERKSIPYREEGTPELLLNTKIKVVPLKDTIAHSGVVFWPVLTPHLPK
jgi:UDP-N-acetyl-D-mannosaminuronate dehydrogenase